MTQASGGSAFDRVAADVASIAKRILLILACREPTSGFGKVSQRLLLRLILGFRERLE
jgi:hypothetical protein